MDLLWVLMYFWWKHESLNKQNKQNILMILQIKHWTSDTKLMKSKIVTCRGYRLWQIHHFPKERAPTQEGCALVTFLPKTVWKQECIPVGCVPSAAVAVCWGGGCLPHFSACWDTHPPGPGPGPQPHPPGAYLFPLDPTMYVIVLCTKQRQSLNPFAAIRLSREWRVKHSHWGMELRSIYTIEFLRLLCWGINTQRPVYNLIILRTNSNKNAFH